MKYLFLSTFFLLLLAIKINHAQPIENPGGIKKVFLVQKNDKLLDLYGAYQNLPLFGVRYKGHLYGFFGDLGERLEAGSTKSNLRSISLANFHVANVKSFNISRSPVWCLRLHIAYDRLWVMSRPDAIISLKVDELPLLELLKKEKQKGIYQQYARNPPTSSVLDHHSMPLRSLDRNQPVNPLSLPDNTTVAGFGVSPISNNSCKCCILFTKTKKLYLWDCSFMKDANLSVWKCKPSADFLNIDKLINDLSGERYSIRSQASSKLEQLNNLSLPALKRAVATNKTTELGRRAQEILNRIEKMEIPLRSPEDLNFESIPSLFLENFYFFVVDKDYYFVTQSGKLYVATAPHGSSAMKRTMRAAWKDSNYPISAILQDGDHHQIWIFCQDIRASSTKGIFFELKHQIKALEYDFSKLNLFRNINNISLLNEFSLFLDNYRLEKK